ncbi:MAG: YqfO family protein [Nitrosarchaeum sp.]|nr:YqfO family protein [Nitrosarchaeum sp.]
MTQVKIVVFVPKTHTDIVRQAMGDAGAGKIGDYSHCSYSVDGFGRYKPTDGANPFIGEVGKFEEVLEERIECVCEREKAKNVIEAMRKVHPYDEVAFDIYPLISEEEL